MEKSIDGRNFSYLSSVIANALSTSANYKAEDPYLFNGINYYRVKIVDNDGKYAYSQVVTLVIKGKTGEIKIFPNPANDRLFIWMPASKTIRSAIIIDAAGRVVIQKNVISNFTNVSDIELHALPAGFYTIKIITGSNAVSNLSFIKN